ncbi:MAG: hypothetical protein M1546_18655, partial [Chloroflexi bacterium]|nr:hypothetical protein [Chloroflexota bacterium]
VLAQFGINQSDQTQDERWQKAHRNAEAYPTRILANTLVNACWRNGPIEDIHAGKEYAYSLNRCRITRDEERLLTRTTLNRMKQALKVVDDLHYEQSKRSWSERVMPFATAFFIAPHNWSLQEHSREIWLPGSEPITQ